MGLIKPAYRPDQLRHMGIFDEKNRLNPLKWILYGEGDEANTAIIDYKVYRLIDGDWIGCVWAHNGPSFGTFRTKELAKAACERHYKKYIHKLQHPTILDWMADLF